jgi:signal transduction histidine kinase
VGRHYDRRPKPGPGSGIVGLADRIEVLGGRLEVVSPAGVGTTLAMAIPLTLQDD